MQAYFLIYRVPAGAPLPGNGIEQPTGGLVADVRDAAHIHDIALQRYHCAPYETLVVEERDDSDGKWKAKCLHRAWDLNRREFERIMTAA